MKTVLVEFAWSGRSVEIRTATAENQDFVDALTDLYAPYKLADAAGALTEETGNRILAEAYAQAVIVGSTSPDLADFEPEEWAAWLIENPDEFQTIQHVAAAPESWEAMAVGGG